jgi:hypothetical protein
MKKKPKYQSMIGGQKGKSLKEIVEIVAGGNGGADLRPKVPTEGPKVKCRRHGKLGSPKSLGSARNAEGYSKHILPSPACLNVRTCTSQYLVPLGRIDG